MKDKTKLMNPFPGLRSFRSDEDYLFFGREEQTQELMVRLERNRFIAVVGTSGRGKSSLVRCGLLSRLQGGGMVGAGAHWEIAVMHPGGDPLRHLAEALLDAGLHDREAEDALPHLLATLRRSQFGLIEAVRQALRPARGPEPAERALPPKTNFLLVVDQFEEIFRYDEAGRAESEVANDFIAMLREASAQSEVPIYIVTTMRSDFIGDCSRFEGLAEAVNRGEYLIPGLTRDQFKAAIEGPIRVAGGQIAPRLLQRLLNDLGEEQDQLPCLQHALMRTWRVWQARADAPALDLEDYAQVGKMSQALSVHADEVFAALANDRQRELCAAMFKALTVEGSEKRGIRRPRRLQTLCGILGVSAAELTPIIDAFRHPEVSFLVPSADVPLRDSTVIDLSHESLMRVWTRLRDWVDDEAKSVGIFRRLSESAALWREGKSGFYRDPELSIARAWVESSRPNAVWAEQYDGDFDAAMAFLQASSDAAQEEVRAQEAARQRELAQARALAETERQRAEEQVRFSGRLKWLLRGVGAVALVALAAMVFALVARREAQQNAALAHQAEVKAEESGKLVDKARGEAERLLSFLLQDFYAELAPTGRLEIVGKLAQEAVAYFDQLPPELQSPVTRRNRAIARLRLGQAVSRGGRQQEGEAIIKSALGELEQMYQGGDRSEATVIGLSAALRADAPLSLRTGDAEEVNKYRLARLRCVEILRPIASAVTSSQAARFEFANALSDLGFTPNLGEQAYAALTEAIEVLTAVGAVSGSNLRALAAYAHVQNRMAIHLRATNRGADAVRWWTESLANTEKVLALEPGNLEALFIRGVSNSSLLQTALREEDRAQAWKRVLSSVEAFDLLIRADPSVRSYWNFGITARRQLAEMLIQDGKVDEGLRVLHTEVARWQQAGFSSGTFALAFSDLAYWEAARGNRAAAEAARVEYQRMETEGMKRNGQSSHRAARFYWFMADYANSVAAATQAIRTVEGRLATSDLTPTQRRASELVLLETALDMGRGNILLGQWAEAESALRLVLPAKVSSITLLSTQTPAEETLRQVRTVASQWLAIALARQGRQAEAAGVLAQSNPEVLHSSYAKGDHSLEVRWNLARYHYASALTQPDDPAGREKRAVALRQAIALLDESTAEAKQLSEERELRRLIDEARALPKR